MARQGVATAEFQVFQRPSDARAYVERLGDDLVIKYDGLAAGKGVFVCTSVPQAQAALDTLEQRYGADAACLVEQRLLGDEISILGLTDGQTIRLLQPSQDHKQLLEGDRGPNTGGMGAFCPVPAFTPAMLAAVRQQIEAPTLAGLRAEGIDYCGVIYFGIMMTAQGPQLLEYNVRLGDPETEVLLPALRSDLRELLEACADGELHRVQPVFNPGFFVDVVLASGGYPGSYPKGLEITGVEQAAEQALVFHAGTRRDGDRLLTSGGRVLNVVAQGPDLESAIQGAYAAAEQINFQGRTLRADIGRRSWCT